VDGDVGGSSARYAPGDTVSIVYDPKNPHKAMVKHSIWWAPSASLVLTVRFLGIGSRMLVGQAHRRQLVAWLRLHGQRVETDYLRLELNRSLEINRKHPFQIVCQWNDQAHNVMHVFKSDDLWFNPEPYIHTKTLTVLVDPADYRRYWVSTDFLPPEGSRHPNLGLAAADDGLGTRRPD
jgi:uncharacterized protein DUF3592